MHPPTDGTRSTNRNAPFYAEHEILIFLYFKENWCKLTDDELLQISGKREQLAAEIEETYGITRREAEKQVWDWGKTVEHVAKKIAGRDGDARLGS